MCPSKYNQVAPPSRSSPCHFIFWTSWKQSVAHQLLHPLLGAGDSHYARWSLYGGGSISASPVCLQCVEQTMENRGNKLRNLPRVDALRRGAGFTLQPRSAARRTNTVSVHAENLRKSPSCLYFPCSLTKGLWCSLSWAYLGSAGCAWSYRLGWRCEATVSRCRCTCSLSGESRLDGAPAARGAAPPTPIRSAGVVPDVGEEGREMRFACLFGYWRGEKNGLL